MASVPPSNPNFYDKFNQFLHDTAAYILATYGVHLDISQIQIPMTFTDPTVGTWYFEEFFASSPDFMHFTITVPAEYANIFTTVPSMAVALLRQMALNTGLPMPTPIPAAPTPPPKISIPINPVGAPTPDGQRYAVAPGYPLAAGSKYTAPDGTAYVMVGTPGPFGVWYFWVKTATGAVPAASAAS